MDGVVGQSDFHGSSRLSGISVLLKRRAIARKAANSRWEKATKKKSRP